MSVARASSTRRDTWRDPRRHELAFEGQVPGSATVEVRFHRDNRQNVVVEVAGETFCLRQPFALTTSDLDSGIHGRTEINSVNPEGPIHVVQGAELSKLIVDCGYSPPYLELERRDEGEVHTRVLRLEISHETQDDLLAWLA